MRSRSVGRAYALTVAIILLSLAFVSAASAKESEQGQVKFLVGAGVLCTLLGPTACPDVASASNGDRIMLAGSGTFTPGDKDVSGGGTFTHTDENGKVLASGTWMAEELISFSPGGSSTFGGFLPAGSEGGLALIKVHLTPSGGEAGDGIATHLAASSGGEGNEGGREAVLTIMCVIIAPFPATVEGISLDVKGGPNFNTQVSGFTLFLQSPEED